MEYKLTSQEIAYIEETGGIIEEAQEAKKQAYIKAGGVTLNPDSLIDLYEACKEALITLDVLQCGDSALIREIKQAIAKAEGKDVRD